MNGNVKALQLCLGSDCRSTWPSSGASANLATGGTVTASAEGQSGHEKEKAFDGDTASAWNANITAGWIAYQLSSTQIVQSYSVLGWAVSLTGAPTTWTFQGSNDGSTWTTLDARTDEDTTTKKTYSLSNSTSYFWYRLNFSAVAGSATWVGLKEMELFNGGSTGSQWTNVPGGINFVSGNVGIGTTNPGAKLDVAGEIKFGNTSSTCNGAVEGQQRYNSVSKSMEFCNGSAWAAVGTSGNYSQGQVVKKTIQKNCTRTPQSTVASVTLESFSVNKQLASSVLLVEGAMAMWGSYNGAMTPGWKFGAGTEVIAQGITYTGAAAYPVVVPVYAVISGHVTTGAQTMVLRLFAQDGTANVAYYTYNPGATDDPRLAQTCSVYVVTEIAQ